MQEVCSWPESAEQLRPTRALAAALTDAGRIRLLRDTLRTAAAIRRTKTGEEVERDEAARRAPDEAPGRARWVAAIARLGH